jgi:hypothetical protein
MRLSTPLLMLTCLCGCSRQSATPALPPIVKISASVRAVPELGISAIESVEVPQESVPAFAKLITPVEPSKQTIRPDMHYHVADITAQHPDGSTTTLIVRWTGHNPAALSLDDRTFFYGGSDEFPDGATRLVRLLNEYHYRPRK